MDFLVAYREAAWNFTSPGPRCFKEFRGFPDMELGIFRVAKSSGEGRGWCCAQTSTKKTYTHAFRALRASINISLKCPPCACLGMIVFGSTYARVPEIEESVSFELR